jgi:hypothetical protein
MESSRFYQRAEDNHRFAGCQFCQRRPQAGAHLSAQNLALLKTFSF